MMAEMSYEGASLPRLPRLKLIAMLGLILMMGFAAYRVHAVARHGSDATSIRNCLENRGPHQVWQNRSTKPDLTIRHYYTCQLEDGRWGLSIIDHTRNGLKEITSFVVKDGSWFRLVEYLSAIARVVS